MDDNSITYGACHRVLQAKSRIKAMDQYLALKKDLSDWSNDNYIINPGGPHALWTEVAAWGLIQVLHRFSNDNHKPDGSITDRSIRFMLFTANNMHLTAFF